MGLSVSSKGGADFEITPEGLYIARCYRVIDQGTQEGFGGKKQKKVSISWELLDDPKMEDGRPFSVHRTYTASLSDKANLRSDLESWRNKKFDQAELDNFDLKNILGTYCQVQVVHDETGKYANVQSLVAYKAPKDAAGKPIYPTPVNENVLFDLDEPDMAVFELLSDNMKAKIMSAPEWEAAKQSASEPAAEEPLDDPFATGEMPDNFLQYDDVAPVSDEELEQIELPDTEPKKAGK